MTKPELQASEGAVKAAEEICGQYGRTVYARGRETYLNAEQLAQLIESTCHLRELEAVVKFAESLKALPEQSADMMKQNGFVLDNLEDRWQKLAFTLHTRLCEISLEAEHALDAAKEGRG